MIDIPQWVLECDFPAVQAAALILNIDPVNPTDTEKEQYEKLLACMRECHEMAITHFLDCLEEDKEFSPPPRVLVSTGLQFRVKLLWYKSAEYWMENEEKIIGFENQLFTRDELNRWISAMGFQSGYQFLPMKPVTEEKTKSQKNSFTTKERRKLLLTILGVVKSCYKNNHSSPTADLALKIKIDLEEQEPWINEKFILERLKEADELEKKSNESNHGHKVSFDHNFLTTAERNMLLLIVLAIAKVYYNYDHGKSKNGAPAIIEKELQIFGINVSDDTIRKYLRDASELKKEML